MSANQGSVRPAAPAPQPVVIPPPAEELAKARAAIAAAQYPEAAVHLGNVVAVQPTDKDTLALVEELYAKAADPLALIQLQGNVFYGLVALRAYFAAKKERWPEAIELLVQIMAARPDVPYSEWLTEWMKVPAAKTALPAPQLARVIDFALQTIATSQLGVRFGRPLASLYADLMTEARPSAPDDQSVNLVLSRALRMARRFDEAIKIATDEDAVRPTFLSAVFLAGAHRDRMEFPQAIAAFERAIERKPDELPARLDLADVALEAGQFDKAIASYEAVLAAKADDVWAQHSIVYARYMKTGDKTLRDELERLAELDPRSRAALLAFAITPFAGYLPRRPEAVISAAEQLTREFEKKEKPTQPIRVDLSAMEAPSAIRAAITHLASIGITLDVACGAPTAEAGDPRTPAGETVYTLYRYEGTKAVTDLTPPDADVASIVTQIAMQPYHAPTWAQLARQAVAALAKKNGAAFGSTPSFLGAMVHPPAMPPQARARVWDWNFRVQVAAALCLAFVDEGWEESVRKRALESLVLGVPDWSATAGIIALVALTNMDPTARREAEGLLYSLIRPASSVIELGCVAQPLAHCLLQLPELAPETRQSFRELRADMERVQ